MAENDSKSSYLSCTNVRIDSKYKKKADVTVVKRTCRERMV